MYPIRNDKTKKQVRVIRHYHDSLCRQGKDCSIEDAAVKWVRNHLSERWSDFYKRQDGKNSN